MKNRKHRSVTLIHADTCWYMLYPHCIVLCCFEVQIRQLAYIAQALELLGELRRRDHGPMLWQDAGSAEETVGRLCQRVQEAWLLGWLLVVVVVSWSLGIVWYHWLRLCFAYSTVSLGHAGSICKWQVVKNPEKQSYICSQLRDSIAQHSRRRTSGRGIAVCKNRSGHLRAVWRRSIQRRCLHCKLRLSCITPAWAQNLMYEVSIHSLPQLQQLDTRCVKFLTSHNNYTFLPSCIPTALFSFCPAADDWTSRPSVICADPPEAWQFDESKLKRRESWKKSKGAQIATVGNFWM